MEVIVQWFADNLGGVISPEAVVFIVSLFPILEDAEPHIVKEIPDSKGILLARENLPEAYACMFTRYVERGNTAWSTDLENKMMKPETKEQ